MLGLCAPARVFAEDLNREFVENFFRPDADSADGSLRIARTEARPDEGTAPVLASDKAEGNGGSFWVGKFFQLAILFLLGLIVYLLSRKTRARGRY